MQTHGTGVETRDTVRMYPNNSLKEPVSEYRNNVAEVVKSTFAK